MIHNPQVSSDPTESPAPPAVPTISLPKGGGAIRGMGEKFAANPVTGTGSMSVPIATSPGRSGFGPQLALSYDSGAGNGPFGFGWNLSLPAITRKTDKGLPQYRDGQESDVFILSGAEDLVPVYRQDSDGSWIRDQEGRLVLHEDELDGYRVRRYRPRIEGLFARIERWTGADGDVHWRSISKDNLLTIYGQDENSRIADPEDMGRIFSWLICETRDDKGNAVVYEYKPEDGTGIDLTQAHERNRGEHDDSRRAANRYLKRIVYGNRTPLLDDAGHRHRFLTPAQLQLDKDHWMFEVVFDYGEHDSDAPMPEEPGKAWPLRNDPFSTYRAGFEVRTCRLCRRVLMFHHFPDEAGVGQDCLVRSTTFDYRETPVAAFITAVTQSGYKRADAGDYLPPKSLPPLEFEYSQPVIGQEVHDVDPASVENLPVGVDGTVYQWVDLDGEGLSGVLTEQGGGWFYKRNQSALAEDRKTPGDAARFSPLEAVARIPNGGPLARGAQFLDLAADGQVDVVELDRPVAGFYERTDDRDWESFRPFTSLPNLAWNDPNLKFVDLTGDGHADVLITEDWALTWYPSLAEDGFGPANRVSVPTDEERGPRVVFADGAQTIFLADLSGDGLTDIARIRNGEVCYWPNLGYGRFGAKVTMDGAPWFDAPDQFNPRRIRLADIDGSGTTDLIYLGRNQTRCWFNQCGNAWGQAHELASFPPVDNVTSVAAVDVLGNGTACLVWSSPLPADRRAPMKYLKLMAEGKPHLLVRAWNNLGAETQVHYVPSTYFYLRDQAEGRPWITKLPFPVHVVERVETYDHISRNHFVTRYAYHHGYFDGVEREFRGFGMVEQRDTEAFAALAEGGAFPIGHNIDAASHVPPMLTKTWFHTGAYLGRDHVSDFFAGLLDAEDQGEYYREPGLTDQEAANLGLDDEARRLYDDARAKDRLLDDTVLPAGLSVEEEREACRALKGSMLRQEVYALDGTEREQHPYTVTEQNFTIQRLQPHDGNRHAVFFTHPREAITYHYERNPADPRIQHALTLEVDDYGNVLKQAAIGYGRRASPLSEQWDRDRQTTGLLTYTENSVTNAIDSPDTHRNPLPSEAITFELTGYAATGPAGRYQASDFVEPDPAAPNRLRHKFTAPEVAYEAPAIGDQRRRPIEWLRTLYRGDDLSDLLPLGILESLALPGETYKLAFTPGLLASVYQRPREAPLDHEPLLPNPEAVLPLPADPATATPADRGGYVDLDGDGHWWIPSGRLFFSPDSGDDAARERAEAQAHFFLPRRHRDPFGQDAIVDFDAYNLLMTETRDALGNRVTVETNDYRVLQPRLVSDPNRNQTEVTFDALGMVVGTAVMGKPPPAPPEGDWLNEEFIAELSPEQLAAFFDATDPHASASSLLQNASTRIVYDLDRFWQTQRAHPDDPSQWQPVCAATLARETHAHAPLPPQGLKIQLSFSYSDGFGREIQKKIQAEKGKVPLRDAQGKIIVGPDNQPLMSANEVTPRWVGSGWTVFNNKGKPIRQFEPFFSDTHKPDFDTKIGVSPALFYDPAERVIATLHPNHTYEKVVFDPWQQTTYDVNDTCAAHNAQTGDPRTDPDIQGYVKGYFDNLPPNPTAPEWQTWHAQRIGGALGADELNAAQRAAAHADTPTTAHFDALGRPFLTVARNRVVCKDHPLNGRPDEEFYTCVELDIEGNQREVIDAKDRIVMRYAYDLLGNRIHQSSMEAGARWMLNDVAGKPIRAWDSRGHNFTTAYDALRRPIEQYVRGTFSDADPLKPNSDPRTLNLPNEAGLLVDKIEYGEGVSLDGLTDQDLNLRTRIYRHSDSAGITTNAGTNPATAKPEAYDFKGNLRRSTRQLVSDYTAIPDWLLNPQLDAETFEGSTRYDALNRPIQSIAPHSSLTRPGHPNKFNVIQPVFNEANLLERVDVWLERAAEPAGLLDPASEAPSPVGVADIDYDAKGQRTLIDYKTRDATVIRTTCAYDRETFRLTHLYTRRGVDPTTAQGVTFTDDCENPNPPPAIIAAPEQPPAGKGCGLQNLHYTYDPAGNITHIRDDAQQTVYFRNQRVEPSNDYVYDALYRLIQADGREHLGQAASGERLPPTAPDGFNAFHTRLDHPGDGNAMGTYTERYVYDAVGNFLQMQHRGSDPAHPGWTRAYTYAEASLTEPGKQSNRLSSTQVGNGVAASPETHQHDTHGNMLRMPHLGGGSAGPNMHWDYKDQLRQVDKGGGGTAFYVYDASGQRVRKVWEKAPGLTEERIYLGGFEIFRRHGGPIGANTATLERETLHVMDDKQRIALVETRTLDTAGDDEASRQLIRYQFGNHLGSASLELDEQAQIISYEEYAPYGSSTYQAVRSRTETAKRYRYTGKERDEESGLHYHGARYYAPSVGRWIATDSVFKPEFSDAYQFVRSNPIVFRDPNGRDWTRFWGGVRAFGGAAQAVGGVAFAALTAETGVGIVGGLAVAAHGVSDVEAGIRQMVTGRDARSITQEGISSGLQAVGVEEEKAEAAATAADITLGFVNPAGPISGGPRFALGLASGGLRLEASVGAVRLTPAVVSVAAHGSSLMGMMSQNNADEDSSGSRKGGETKPELEKAESNPSDPAPPLAAKPAEIPPSLRLPNVRLEKTVAREGGLTFLANKIKGLGQGKGATVQIALAITKKGKQILVAGINSGSKGLNTVQLKQLEEWGVNIAPLIKRGMKGAPHAEENIAAFLDSIGARGVRWSKAVVGSLKPSGSSYVCGPCREVIKRVGGRIEDIP